MVWYGMVWYGMVWYGMVWYGMVWYGMVWCDMVCGIEGVDCTKRYGMAWYVVVLYGISKFFRGWKFREQRFSKTPWRLVTVQSHFRYFPEGCILDLTKM
jgi:hypothetical protein